MQGYTIEVIVGSATVKTVIYAESAGNARLLAGMIFGPQNLTQTTIQTLGRNE